MRSDIPYFWYNLKRSKLKTRAIKLFIMICICEFCSLILTGRLNQNKDERRRLR